MDSHLEDLPTLAICAGVSLSAGFWRLLRQERRITGRAVLAELGTSGSASIALIGALEWYDPQAPRSAFWAVSVIGGHFGTQVFSLIRAAAGKAVDLISRRPPADGALTPTAGGDDEQR